MDDGIVGRLETGLSQVQIPRNFNVTPSIVSIYRNSLRILIHNETVSTKLAKTFMTANEDCYLFITVRGNRSTTALEVFGGFYVASGNQVSKVTLQNSTWQSAVWNKICVWFWSLCTICFTFVKEPGEYPLLILSEDSIFRVTGKQNSCIFMPLL